MAAHSNILAWRIPWREEPGRLQSKGSKRVRNDCETFTFTFKGFKAGNRISSCWSREVLPLFVNNSSDSYAAEICIAGIQRRKDNFP